MLIPRTIADPTRPPDDRSAPPTHVNLQTHWWDGSQIYPTNQQLEASRRLTSDRFFGNDYTPEIYTPQGIDWIENTTMLDVMTRHYPGLHAALRGTANAFTPWSGARA